MQHSNTDSCILLKFYIKPQLRRWRQCHYVVVSYWNSTSNHNSYPLYSYWVQVVSYWNSTSNHNFALNVSSPTVLYLIEILHQTTTSSCLCRKTALLYLIEILHQTTTLKMIVVGHNLLYLIEILHQTTTVNSPFASKVELYLIEILHQTTTNGTVSNG